MTDTWQNTLLAALTMLGAGLEGLDLELELA
jgi:hypothetical protein